jgi:hypothetical protein
LSLFNISVTGTYLINPPQGIGIRINQSGATIYYCNNNKKYVREEKVTDSGGKQEEV